MQQQYVGVLKAGCQKNTLIDAGRLVTDWYTAITPWFIKLQYYKKRKEKTEKGQQKLYGTYNEYYTISQYLTFQKCSITIYTVSQKNVTLFRFVIT